jgi:phosphopantothenoylcysteine synthetase/decarboxylase
MRRSFIGLAVATIAMLTPLWALAGDTEMAQQPAFQRPAQRLQHWREGSRRNGVA